MYRGLIGFKEDIMHVLRLGGSFSCVSSEGEYAWRDRCVNACALIESACVYQSITIWREQYRHFVVVLHIPTWQVSLLHSFKNACALCNMVCLMFFKDISMA